MTALSSLPGGRGYRLLLDRQPALLALGTATSRASPTCNAAQSVSEPSPQSQQERKQVKLPERGFFAEANTKGAAAPVTRLGIADIVTQLACAAATPPPTLPVRRTPSPVGPRIRAHVP